MTPILHRSAAAQCAALYLLDAILSPVQSWKELAAQAPAVIGSRLTFDQDWKLVAMVMVLSLAPSLIAQTAVCLRPPSIFWCKRTESASLRQSA